MFTHTPLLQEFIYNFYIDVKKKITLSIKSEIMVDMIYIIFKLIVVKVNKFKSLWLDDCLLHGECVDWFSLIRNNVNILILLLGTKKGVGGRKRSWSILWTVICFTSLWSNYGKVMLSTHHLQLWLETSLFFVFNKTILIYLPYLFSLPH